MTDKDPNLIISLVEGMNASRWMILAIVLLGVELVTGTTYILWVAAAALIMAGLVFIFPLSWGVQFVLFFILSVVLLVLGHKYVRPKFKGGEPADLNDRARTMVGEPVKAVADFEFGKGRVSHGDTQWAAALISGKEAKAGDQLRIVSVKGATLQVEAV